MVLFSRKMQDPIFCYDLPKLITEIWSNLSTQISDDRPNSRFLSILDKTISPRATQRYIHCQHLTSASEQSSYYAYRIFKQIIIKSYLSSFAIFHSPDLNLVYTQDFQWNLSKTVGFCPKQSKTISPRASQRYIKGQHLTSASEQSSYYAYRIFKQIIIKSYLSSFEIFDVPDLTYTSEARTSKWNLPKTVAFCPFQSKTI